MLPRRVQPAQEQTPGQMFALWMGSASSNIQCMLNRQHEATLDLFVRGHGGFSFEPAARCGSRHGACVPGLVSHPAHPYQHRNLKIAFVDHSYQGP
eukprot:scaffold16075_cov19-Tisochrysis_lutea.AAC.5